MSDCPVENPPNESQDSRTGRFLSELPRLLPEPASGGFGLRAHFSLEIRTNSCTDDCQWYERPSTKWILGPHRNVQVHESIGKSLMLAVEFLVEPDGRIRWANG